MGRARRSDKNSIGMVNMNKRSDLDELRRKAKSVVNPHPLSSDAEAGSVGAALLTESGNVDVGVCLAM